MEGSIPLIDLCAIGIENAAVLVLHEQEIMPQPCGNVLTLTRTPLPVCTGTG